MSVELGAVQVAGPSPRVNVSQFYRDRAARERMANSRVHLP
jgi:hypothetical protein